MENRRRLSHCRCVGNPLQFPPCEAFASSWDAARQVFADAAMGGDYDESEEKQNGSAAAAALTALKRTTHLVLMGLPGCGKVRGANAHSHTQSELFTSLPPSLSHSYVFSAPGLLGLAWPEIELAPPPIADHPAEQPGQGHSLAARPSSAQRHNRLADRCGVGRRLPLCHCRRDAR